MEEKSTFFIYCPDTSKIVLRSDIRSADPKRGAIVNKQVDNDDPKSDDKSDILLPKIPNSGEILEQSLKRLDRLKL